MDVIQIDLTYKVNHHKHQLSVVTGADSFKQNVPFFFSLVENEKEAAFITTVDLIIYVSLSILNINNDENYTTDDQHKDG